MPPNINIKSIYITACDKFYQAFPLEATIAGVKLCVQAALYIRLNIMSHDYGTSLSYSFDMALKKYLLLNGSDAYKDVEVQTDG